MTVAQLKSLFWHLVEKAWLSDNHINLHFASRLQRENES